MQPLSAVQLALNSRAGSRPTGVSSSKVELTNRGSVASELALRIPSPHSEAGVKGGPSHTPDIYAVSGLQTPVFQLS